MKKNFSHLIREELVKRFESVVKDEIRKNDLSIQEYQNQLNKFRQDFKEFQFVVSQMHDHANKNWESCKVEIGDHKNAIRDIFYIQKNYIKENIDESRKVLKELRDNQEKLVSSDEFSVALESISSFIKKNLKDIHQALDESNKQFADSLLESESESDTRHMFLECIIDDLKAEIEELHATLKGCKVEYDGIMRELAIQKKTVFVNEKHIEYLVRKIKQLEDKQL